MTTGSTYYAIYVDASTIKVASSQGNANAGTALSLSGTGAGSQFFIGVQATGTVTQSGGALTSTTITNAGTGYSGSPQVTITDAAGNGGAIDSTVGKGIGTVSINDGGQYTSAPTVTFTNDVNDTTGTGAAGTVAIGFPIASITLTSQGLGYRNIPAITFTGGDPDTDAQATAVLDEKTGRISGATLDTAGVNFTSAPTVAFVGGAGKDGIVNIDIQSLAGSVTSSGSGYSAGTYSNVQFTGGSPTTTATATFTVPGFGGSITSGGSGYTDGTYSVSFRNTPTTTYTVTVAPRAKIQMTGITGTFAVGNTVTGSVSGATGTVTAVGTDFVYCSNVSGTFLDAQQEDLSNGSGATGTISTYSASVNRYFINGAEAPNLTLTDNNTYRFDQSDASNANHPLAWDSNIANIVSRTAGTPGTAGAYSELVVGSTSPTTPTGFYTCQVHGISMSEPSVVTFQTGAAGDSGTGMAGDIEVSGGAVTSVTINAQGQDYSIGDVLLLDAADVGGTGSGFQFTLNTNQTGISTVTDISLVGAGYQVGDVLSVDDANVGSGGGSGFQFTVSAVGFATAVTIQSPGAAFETADTLILDDVGGAGIAQGTGITLDLTAIVSEKSIELNQDGDLKLGPNNNLVLSQDGSIVSSSGWSIQSSGSLALGAGTIRLW